MTKPWELAGMLYSGIQFPKTKEGDNKISPLYWIRIQRFVLGKNELNWLGNARKRYFGITFVQITQSQSQFWFWHPSHIIYAPQVKTFSFFILTSPKLFIPLTKKR